MYDRNTPIATILVLITLCCALASATGTATNLADRDVVGVDVPLALDTTLKKQILESVGSSHAATALRADWQRQFAQTVKDIGFKRVRFHGLLDDDMSVLMPDGSISMFNVFSIFDFLLSLDVRPIVELSFMPALLASNATEWNFHYDGGASAPRDYDEWTQFIAQVVGLMVERYGISEVSLWMFEVWNEPNCNFLSPKSGCCFSGCGPVDVYWKLYNATATGVKRVSSDIAVGGPATAQVGWVKEFLAWASDHGAPVDFVSTHLYPTDPNVVAGRDGFMQTLVKYAVNEIKASTMPHLPLIVTEFNAGLGIQVASTKYSGSFAVHQLALSQEQEDIHVLSFWAFSDIFEEGGMHSNPYEEGIFGMQTIYDVKKPVYRTFEMIAKLYGSGVAVSSNNVDAVVSVQHQDKDGGVGAAGAGEGRGVAIYALLTNFAIYGSNITAVDAALELRGVHDCGTAIVEIVDDEHCNPMDVWRRNGSPRYPTYVELQAERRASQLTPTSINVIHTQKGAVSAATATVTLEPHATALVHLSCELD